MASTVVATCPRCSADKITFDVRGQQFRSIRYDWQNSYEVFCICRSCSRSTVFLLGLNEISQRDTFYRADGLVSYNGDLSNFFDNEGYISQKDTHSVKAPEFLPQNIQSAFEEGAACFAIGAYNAAATMFRLCLDLATRPLLPAPDGGAGQAQPNQKQRRDLGLRLAWLFDANILPSSLRELSNAIREDANDGAHVGNLSKVDAEDTLDFTVVLLDRLISEPKRIENAEARRAERRNPK